MGIFSRPCKSARIFLSLTVKLRRGGAGFQPARQIRCFVRRILGPDKPPVARIQTLFIKKMIVKVEQNASIKKVRDYLLAVQRAILEDERFRSLLVYYDVDPQ